ncbi:hypothetical protein B484DRAFT_453656 [Ochromonadaceae sp. CCMP2298]|nr:hypothetical protein B484DRAFT_453656 [Ochromonadaceae sp. CCMP2298]|mmetsp:Transcript_33059/g.72814  ORF Transcript_33059/g.72814 Transcript_33059/m.72814 type:complete len:277 (+) Transcript_33059:121-951(+)
MDFYSEAPKSFRLLVCRDVDGPSSARIAEHFVPNEPMFDAILLAGPLLHQDVENKEDKAVAEGDISSIFAQLENIVCRVLYLPSEYDPSDILAEQLHLTPNSVNIHGRQIALTDTLHLMGFSEKGEKIARLAYSQDDRDRSAESDDEMENVQLSSANSISIITEMLTNSAANQPSAPTSTPTTPLSSGIFMLNYRYSHTLNQLLFHMGESLDSAGVRLCVLCSDSPETDRLPAKFGNYHIAAPKSLRETGGYTVVDIAFNEDTAAWDEITVTNKQL